MSREPIDGQRDCVEDRGELAKTGNAKGDWGERLRRQAPALARLEPQERRDR